MSECPPGVHSMFDFCPGDCTDPDFYGDDDDDMSLTERVFRPMTPDQARAVSEAMNNPDLPTTRLPCRECNRQSGHKLDCSTGR